MILSTIQTDPAFGQKEKNLTDALALMDSVRADLYVLPELFASGYNFETLDEVRTLAEPFAAGATHEAMTRFATRTRSFVCYGFAESAEGGNMFYNSSALVGYDGTSALYRKIHLFDREKLFFTPGNLEFSVTETPVGRVGMMICFDWYFPESARTLALRGAQIIAHPSNLVLPNCPAAMPIRSLENRIFSATANRIGTEERAGRALRFIGQSQITSPRGEILHRSPLGTQEAASVMIAPELADNKFATELNNLFQDRRPEFYA